MKVLLIMQNFVTSGNQFKMGEYYMADPQGRNGGGWLSITNREYHYRATIPANLVEVTTEEDVHWLGGEMRFPIIDRTNGSLTRAEGGSDGT